MNVRPHVLERVQIEVTNHCNFSCAFCAQTAQTRPRRHMDLEVFQRVVEDIASTHLAPRVALHVLGEPLLHPGLDEAIACARQLGLEVELTTNGSLLDERRVERLARAGLDLLQISVVSLQPDEHTFRGTSLDFDTYYARVLSAVRAAAAVGLPVRLRVISTWSKRLFSVAAAFHLNESRAQLRDTLERLVSDLARVTGLPVTPAQVRDEVGRSLRERDVVLEVGDGPEIFVRTFFDWGNALAVRQVVPARLGRCPAALRTLSVLSDGSVVPCCSDWDGKARLGSVAEASLAELIAGPEARLIQEGFDRYRVAHPACQSCLGATSRTWALVKGLVSCLLYHLHDPVGAPHIRLFEGVGRP